jgi:hypothetical protein
MDREPAIIISTTTALLTALIGGAAAFGLNLTDTKQNAILSVVAPTVALLFLLGPIIRTFVYSPDTVQQKVNEAASKGAAGEVQTPVAK